MDATVGQLERDARELARRRGLDPVEDFVAFRSLVSEVVAEHEIRSLAGHVTPLMDPVAVQKDIVDAVAGLGPLQQYLDDPSIEEIWINEPGKVFVARSGVPELTPTILDHQGVKDLVERMLRTSGRRLDLSQPFVDAALPNGERLHVVIPPITRRSWAVNIRKFIARARHLGDLVSRGSLTHEAATFLAEAVAAGKNIVVSGATQAGKTTMIGALAGAIPAGQRVITCEEVFELNIASRDCVALQCRQSSLEGLGEIPLRRLVKEALRMRPDRIIVGEVREAEAFDLLIGLNAGLPGMSTVHANSAREAVTKLATLPLLAGENVTASFVTPTLAQALDIVVHLDLDSAGRRTVREVVGISGRIEGSVIETSTIFASEDGELRAKERGAQWASSSA